MKYLLVTCSDYKGGEIGTVQIYDSIQECLDEVSDDFGETFEEYIENKREVIENKHMYAGGDDGYCFQIHPLEEYNLGRELGDDELLKAIEAITVDDWKVLWE